MAKKWEKSAVYTDVYYYGEDTQGCLEKDSRGAWRWSWYARDENRGTFLGRNLRKAKICAAALVELEG